MSVNKNKSHIYEKFVVAKELVAEIFLNLK
jgi:hypothetical protein